MSRTLAAAAYRRLIEAVPAAAVDALDRPLTDAKARHANAKDARKASLWAMGVRTPSKWYATDGTHCFYYFRRRKLDIELIGYPGIARVAITVHGTTASQAYYRHGGQLTDRRPAGWQSITTISGINYGGYGDGPLRACGWESNEDLDFDVDAVDRIRAQQQGPFITGSLHDYAEQVIRATAGV